MEQIFAFKKDNAVFRFYISEDKSIYLKIEGHATVSPVDMFSFLIKKGVKESFIIKPNIISASNTISEHKTGGYLKEFLVAKSKITEKNKEVKIDFAIKPDNNPPVKKGDLIGTVLPGQSCEITDPYGNVTVVPSPFPVELILKNAVLEAGTRKLFAAESGLLVVELPAVKVLPEMSVEITEDLCTAYMSICTRKELTFSELNSYLSAKEILYGIDESALKILAMKTKDSISTDKNKLVIQEKTPVAFGVPMVNGRDGRIEWLVDTKRTVIPDDNSETEIDFKETSLINNVKKGETLAIRHPGEKGTPGISVSAKTIPPDSISESRIKLGIGTMESQDGKIIMAADDGAVFYKNDTLTVEKVYEINRNVDFAVGNIKFDGVVVVKGDVYPGFKVDATSDVSIYGTMSGQMLNSGGSVKVGEGIFGVSPVITVAGDLAANYISDAKAKIGQNLYIESYIKDSDVQCFGSIIIKKSGIVGKKILVNRGLMCQTLGNDMGAPTYIIAGMDTDKYEKVGVLKKEIEKLGDDIKRCEEDILALKNEKSQLVMVQQEYDMIITELNAKKAELSTICENGEELLPPINKLAVLEAIYSGVKIEMRGKVIAFNEMTKGPILVFYNFTMDEIQMRHLAMPEITMLRKRFNHWLELKEEVVN